jgi:hypothetical protein
MQLLCSASGPPDPVQGLARPLKLVDVLDVCDSCNSGLARNFRRQNLLSTIAPHSVHLGRRAIALGPVCAQSF